MKRRFPDLAQELDDRGAIPEGLYLVCLQRASYFGRPKAFYQLQFRILRPEPWTDRVFPARLYCTPKAVSKLLWFLQAFAYDAELLGRGEIDDRALVGLQGIVRISRPRRNGWPYWNLDAFAPESRWSDPTSRTDALGEVS
jgi:hypothetical protein